MKPDVKQCASSVVTRMLEGDDLKKFLHRQEVKRGHKKLTSAQVERMADILAYGPITRRPSDDIFIELGLAEIYDGETTAIDGTRDAAKRFYYGREDVGEIMGAVRKEWYR